MLHLNNIGKSFDGQEIIKNINLHIAPGEKVGLIGNNGTGKSTLMKIIAGIFPPDKGDIVIAPHSTIAYLPQERQCDTNNNLYNEMLTLFSDVFSVEKELRIIEKEMQNLSSDSKELFERYSFLQSQLDMMEVDTIEARIGKVLSGLGFVPEDYEKITGHFSGGWQARIELAKILLQSPNLLLLDEPTNHLDLEAIEWLEEFLEHYSGSFLIVSHDRYLLDRLTERTVEIEYDKISEYYGNYSYYVAEKEHRKELGEAKYENQQKQLQETQKFIDRFRYKATKARQVQNRIKMIDKIEKVDAPQGESRKINFTFLFEKESGREVIRAKNLTKSYDGRTILEKLEFLIEKGDKIAIIGKNGTGKTTLLKLLAGLVNSDRGSIESGYNVVPAYFSQHQAEILEAEKTVIEELRDCAPLSISDQTLRTILGCFLFTGDNVLKKIGDLSGGEKSRVALAKIIVNPSNLLLIDEPTNHLDISSREELENALEEYPGTVLFISHDRFFIDKLSDKIFEIEDCKLNIYPGNYSYYIEKKNRALQQKTVNQEMPVKRKPPGKKQKKSENEAVSIDKLIKSVENEIEVIEKRIQEIELNMSEPDFFSGEGKDSIITEYSGLKKILPSLYEKWENFLA